MIEMAPETLPQLLLRNAERTGGAPAIREKRRGVWRTVSWRLWSDETFALAAALSARGVTRGARIAFLGENRPRLFGMIAAAQALGAIAMPMFPDATAEEIAEPLRVAKATHIFAQNQEQVDKALAAAALCPAIQCVVYDDPRSMGAYDDPLLVQYDALLAEAAAEPGQTHARVQAEIARGQGAEAAFLFLTSGATGPAKGVLLSHAALIDRARAAAEAERLNERDSTIAYLPPGWLPQILFGYVQPLVVGHCVYCPESSETLLGDMREIAPTVFLTTPRMLDTLVSQVSLRMQDTGGLSLRLFTRAVDVAQRIGRRRLAHEPVPFGDRMNAGLYEALVYGPLRDSLGMSRIRVAYCTGDAIDPAVLSFFRALRVNLKQLYGSTETGFVTALQRDGEVKLDTVGHPAANVEVMVSPDREILARSPGLFLGYLDDPAATAAALSDEGWFRTGDLGWIGDDGQLRILDRMADVGALADGTPFMPRYVENRIKFSPYIREAIVIGDGRDRVCALIDVNTAAVGRWADSHGIPFTGHADLASQPEVCQLIEEWLARVNLDLAADAEHAGCQVHRFALLPNELSPDDGVLTRTGKIRRAAASARFAVLIDALYGGRSEVALATAGDGMGDADAGHIVIPIRDARIVAQPPARSAA